MADKEEKAVELRFDLRRITAREMAVLNKAIRENDIELVAEYMASVCIECPYGDPKDKDTFLGLPYFGEFQTVLIALAKAGRDAAKN